jgi:aquaporin related protein
VVAQLLAGIAAAGLASVVIPGPLKVGNALGNDVTAIQGFFLEILLTAQLVFVILMVAVEKHKSTYLAPVAIGTTLFLAHLVGTCIPSIPLSITA